MTEVKQWLVLDPLDTLFFRGAEAMIAGESHEVRSIFPPMPSTLVGALRTAVLLQRKINPLDFTKNGGPSHRIREDFPLLGTPEKPVFEVLGPVLRVRTRYDLLDWFYTAPANWFMPDWDPPARDWEKVPVGISVADRLPEEARQDLRLCGTVANPLWVLNPLAATLKSLAGFWANRAALEKGSDGSFCLTLQSKADHVGTNEPVLVQRDALVTSETRVGIGMDLRIRRVKKGHLYAASHFRLKAGVSMAIGLSEPLIGHYLDEAGVLQLGGEARMVRYELLDEPKILPKGKSGWIMALNSFPYAMLAAQGFEGLPRCSGPLTRMGGWDMQKGFHKDMTAFLPAGTVIKVEEERPIPFGFIRI